jgi:peptidoglycan/xylan/chitin deacetylase (PgdA/CDA1 family)
MVLSYHNIATQKGFWTLSYQQFKEQVLFLRDHYKVVSIDDYVTYVFENGRSETDAVVITFDDAYCSYATDVVPLLNELSVPSTVFVCTGYLGKSNEWNDEENRSPIMSAGEVKGLSANPLVTIGAHTVYHQSLAGLQRPVAYFELNESKRYLQELLGRRIDYVAYPYGQLHQHVNGMVMNLARDLEYKAAFTTNADLTNNRDVRYRMNRLDLSMEEDLETFKLKLQPGNPFLAEQKRLNRAMLMRSMRILGYTSVLSAADRIPDIARASEWFCNAEVIASF